MNRINLLIAAILLFGVACSSGTNKSDKSLDAATENKIDSIMAQMTIEEKIGQMSQFAIDLLGKGGNAYFSHEPFEIDEAMLDSVIGRYKVGSILSASNTRAQTTDHRNVGIYCNCHSEASFRRNRYTCALWS